MNYRNPRRAIGPSSSYSNVIDLAAVRKRLGAAPTRTVFYLNNRGEWLPALETLGLQVMDIHSPEALTTQLLARIPEIVLIESDLEWTDALETLSDLTSLVTAPIVMLVDPHSQRLDPQLVKKAYAAGVSDTLFSPLEGEELKRTLDVLVKFQRQVSY